jgi:ATP-dependent Zn protease
MYLIKQRPLKSPKYITRYGGIRQMIPCNSIEQQYSLSIPSSIEYLYPSPRATQISIRAPQLKEQTNNSWQYSTFLLNIQNNTIDYVKITQDQKFIDVHFKNGQWKSLLLPEGYDYMNFLIQNKIDVHVVSSRKISIELSFFDICLIICQCIFLVYVIRTIIRKNKVESLNDYKDTRSNVSLFEKLPSMNEIQSNKLDDDIHMAAYRESGQLLSSILVDDKLENISIEKQTDPIIYQNVSSVGENREFFEKRIKILIGGRVAEEIIFGALRSSSGKSTDLEIIVQLAYDIIATYGFSKTLGITEWDSIMTPEINNNINISVKKIIKRCYKQVRKFIIKNKDTLDYIANELIIKKTLNQTDIGHITNSIKMSHRKKKY